MPALDQPVGNLRVGEAERAGSPPGSAPEERVLIVLNPGDPVGTVRSVLREVDPSNVGCHLLLVYPTAEYEARRRGRIETGVNAPYTIDHLADEARQTAARVGKDWIDGIGADFEAMGYVGRTRDAVLGAARRYHYDRIYVPRSNPSIWSRILSSDPLPDELGRALPAVVKIISVSVTSF
ncbi:MAG: hypothetical protein R3324_14030 [Halobacteriales archaeon]|nr:hypothetical protein [Halobacteriales archaeon]